MRSRRWIGVVVAFAAACGGAPAPPRSIVVESVTHSARLRNGLRVLIAHDQATNLVDVAIRVDVGSASDPPGKSGLAHLAEHLMFHVRGPAGPIAAAIAETAIGFNAVTEREATTYLSAARVDQLDRLLELEALRFSAGCEAIDPGSFEREREVTRNELRREGDFSDGDPLLSHLAPRGHRYARPVGGTDAQLSQLTLADVCAFLSEHYRPDRMVVVLSGEVPLVPTVRSLSRHLGRLTGWGHPSATSTPRPAGPLAPSVVAGRRVVRGDPFFGPSSMLVVAWPLPPAHGPEEAANAVALSLLRGEIEEDFGSTAALFELGDWRAPAAAVVISLDVDGRSEEEATETLALAIDRAGAELTTTAFDAVIAGQARRLLEEFDQPRARVWRLAGDYQIAGDDHLLPAQMSALGRLTPSDVSDAVRRLFTAPRAEIRFEPDAARAASRRRPQTPSYAGKRHDDAWTAPVDPAEASRPLRVPLPRSIGERAERFRLSNGLQVVLLSTPGVPLLRAQLVFAGGWADDPADQLGLGEMAAELLQLFIAEDGPPRTALHHRTDWLVEGFRADVGPDWTIFSVTGLAAYLDVVLPLPVLYVKNGEYSQRLLNRLEDRREELRREAHGPRATASQRGRERAARLQRALYQAAFGDSHPYARFELLGQSRSNIGAYDLDRLRRQRFAARNGVLVVTGRFDAALTRQHIEQAFGVLREGEAQVISRPPAAPRAARTVIAIASEPDDANASIQILCATPADPARRAARMVLGRILRERMSRVREVLGASYDATARHIERLGPGMFFIDATVDANRLDESLAMMMDELAQLRSDRSAGLAEAFVRARRQALYELLAESSGIVDMSDRLALLAVSGKGALDSEIELARQIMDLTVADLEPLLADDLAPEHQVIGLLGPAASIASARRAARL